MNIMEDMIKRNHIDGDIFTVLKQNIEEINQIKINAQRSAVSAFWSLKSVALPQNILGR